MTTAKFDMQLYSSLKEVAHDLAKAPFMWEPYRGQPANVLVAIMKGANLGLDPVTSLESIALVRGKLTLFGDGFLSVVQSHPQYAGHKEMTHEEIKANNYTAVCTFYRRNAAGEELEHVATYSIEDAKRAGRWGSVGPWKSNPMRMLAMRARGFAGRNAFSDALKGLIIHEEAIDLAEELDATENGRLRKQDAPARAVVAVPPKPEPKPKPKPEGVELAKKILGAEEPSPAQPDMPKMQAKKPVRQSPHAVEAEDEQKTTRRRRRATPPAPPARKEGVRS